MHFQMMTMRTFAHRQNQPGRHAARSLAQSKTAMSGPHPTAHPILYLQNAIGNQAVQRMLHTNAKKFEVGLAATATPCFEQDSGRITSGRPAALLRQKGTPPPKKPTRADIIEEARGGAFIRVLIANHRVQGVGPPGPPGPRSAEIDAMELQLRAKRLAQILFNWPDPNMSQIGEIIGRMLTALSPGTAIIQAAAGDRHCAGLVPAYVIGNKRPIVLCPRFFSMSPEDQIRTMVHESAHVAGIGQPKGEGYCIEFDCKTACPGDFNAADSWSHYVHCLSGQSADVPIASKPSGGSPKPAPGGKP